MACSAAEVRPQRWGTSTNERHPLIIFSRRVDEKISLEALQRASLLERQVGSLLPGA
jgi:hypothetical protein